MSATVSPTIVERYLAGASTRTLAEQERVSIGTINRRLRSAGVQIRSVGGQRRTDYAAVLAARAAGASYRALGERFGVHFSSIYRIVQEHGA